MTDVPLDPINSQKQLDELLDRIVEKSKSRNIRLLETLSVLEKKVQSVIHNKVAQDDLIAQLESERDQWRNAFMALMERMTLVLEDIESEDSSFDEFLDNLVSIISEDDNQASVAEHSEVSVENDAEEYEERAERESTAFVPEVEVSSDFDESASSVESGEIESQETESSPLPEPDPSFNKWTHFDDNDPDRTA